MLVELEMPTIAAAIQTLAERKLLPRGVGDFARMILVCATYQTTFTVLNYLRSPLMPAIDTEMKTIDQVSSNAKMILEALRPRDQLGPEANESLRSSLECHIALALMLLHIRRKDVLGMARSFETRGRSSASHQRLTQWLRDDSANDAKRAAAHAGALLATLRRRSTRGFHEPIVTLLAVLVLWTYNLLVGGNSTEDKLNQPDSRPPQIRAQEQASERGSVVRLDIPTSPADMAAWYAGRQGLRPHLQDVGNLNRPGAGPSILQVGQRMLQNMNVWALSHGFGLWLEKLISHVQ
jgi:hypothetical protein